MARSGAKVRVIACESFDYNLNTQMRLAVHHFRDATAPIVCCVAMGRTAGQFEANVRSLGLTEGVDYYHFN